MESVETVSAWRLWFGSALAAVACAVALVATAPGLPMVWDEGNAIVRAEGIAHGQWEYTTKVEGHPALYGIVIALGQWLAPAWLAPLTAARLGPMLLFSLATGAMFYRMGREYSLAAATGSVAALLFLPRMFAHAHFASFDGPLTACWMLAWATFAPACRCRSFPGDHSVWAWRILWGITVGMTLSCKATGWLAPLPFLVWAITYRHRGGLWALAVGIAVALLTFFLLNPPLWSVPIQGWAVFFDLNLHRGDHWNIPILFLGQMHHLGAPLPWYNTLFWTAITVPLGILLLAALGVTVALRTWQSHPAGALLLFHWLVLLVARALPGTPVHDGIRLFLPSFAFLAALAGVGCGALLQSRLRPTIRWSAVVLLYAGSASSLFWYAPQWLSYYNLLIGGLRGATAVGMEPTYYWDALDQSVLDWLHEHTGPGDKIAIGACSPETLALMERWQLLRRATRQDAPGTFRWYVLQRRPSGFSPADRWLVDRVPPVHTKVIRSQGMGPWCLDVPLVDVYSYSDYLQAREATLRQGVP